ncbi:MAG TPA: hypothetical protein VL738_05315 [Dactylosporangium sp.]|nr:hypothetical protein [Dactylosporangium sp.]
MELVEDLAGEDRQRASDRLVAMGEAAVGPVLAVLCDERSPVAWSTAALVLQRIGEPALEPLVGALAAAATTEVARRCSSTLGGLRAADGGRFAALLSHPAPRVRESAASALQDLRADVEPYLPALAGVLDDPDEAVRRRARLAIEAAGWLAVPMLREIRRGTGRRRTAALTVLADVGGWDALDEADRRAVARLIEIKAAREVPAPMHLCGSWFAVPTADQSAVLDAFGLGEPRAVTMRLGGSAWTRDHHGWSSVPHAGCRRTYVTPALDGWTLVFGKIPAVAHAAPDDSETVWRDEVRARCAALSARFGAAHCYGASCGDGWTAWCLAEDGEVIRFYDAFEPGDQTGEPHPAEAGLRLPHISAFPMEAFEGVPREGIAERFREIQRTLPAQAHATTLAARLSVDPSALGPHTTVAGRAVLALTPCGLAEPSTPGALAI